MAKAVLSKMRATELDKLLGNNIYKKYRKVMDAYIIDNLKNDGEFSIPIIQTLVEESSPLGKHLIELYDRKILLDRAKGISNEMKILQASAFDGLVVGVNIAKGGELAIYTANTDVIFGIDSESKFSMDKTFELNEQGIVNAVRIDIEYTSEDGFDYKVVSLNKNTNLQIVDEETGKGRFFLVPYIAIQRSMAFFEEYLKDGRTMEVIQDVEGLMKVRYISTKVTELEKYCDSKEFVKTLKPEFFPLKGFFYAPVLGASSLTTGRTKIDLVNVSKVSLVSKPKVEKADKVVENLIVESTIQKALVSLYNSDLEEYSRLVEKLPKRSKFFDDMSDMPSPVVLMKYYHQLRGADLDKFYKVVSPYMVETDYGVLQESINMCEEVHLDGIGVDEVKKMLKQGIYKINIRKKDCRYSSMIVSNNEEILKKFYGDDYFGLYESLGTRLYKLEDMVFDGIDLSEALDYCGFPSDRETVKDVQEVLKSNEVERSQHERLAEIFKSEDTVGKGVRKSSSNSNIILVRKCFASLGSNGAIDFYRYLDVSKVVSIFRIG